MEERAAGDETKSASRHLINETTLSAAQEYSDDIVRIVADSGRIGWTMPNGYTVHYIDTAKTRVGLVKLAVDPAGQHVPEWCLQADATIRQATNAELRALAQDVGNGLTDQIFRWLATEDGAIDDWGIEEAQKDVMAAAILRSHQTLLRLRKR